ncbi:ATP-binding protein [Archangium sp.]|uniref:ATP-binding protein n=1 Tax=Archangium sp. TaxID=1872627 RepID=UPI00389ADE36
MVQPTKTQQAELRIDAHVIRQLGDQLITDAQQALLELIKNSYDADAEWARVQLSTEHEPDPTLALDPNARGMLSIEDNGSGMTLERIKDGWLTISLSPKRGMKDRGEVTKKFRRTPLGDKGLGRLGTMKLGDLVEIVTHHHVEQEGFRVRLKWSDFKSGKPLNDIKVTITPVPATKKTGTRLSIFGLTSPTYWKGERRLSELQTELSKLVSPFEGISKFKWSISIDGSKIDLEALTKRLRSMAQTRFTLEWDDQSLTCSGHIKASLFETKKDDSAYVDMVEADNGAALLKFLLSQKGAEGFSVKKSTEEGWFLQVSRKFTWEEIANREPGAVAWAKPGPFRAEIDSFDLNETDWGPDKAFTSAVSYKEYVKKHAGVAVYRDGFVVHMQEDWLGLGKAQTSGRSYYGLRPSNAIGFVAITSAGNPLLTEKSDREGFIDTPALRGFNGVLGEFVKFINDSQTFLRRTYNVYRESQKATEAQLPADWSPRDAVQRLSDVTQVARSAKQKLDATEQKQRSSIKRVRDNLARTLKKVESDPALRAEVEGALGQLQQVTSELEKRRGEIAEALGALSEQAKVADAILDRFAQMKHQIGEVYETVGIGLVAQALAHDAHALIDDLLSRTQKISRKVGASKDPTLLSYLEAVKATANSLRKQLSLLDPMLRATRETKNTFKLSEFLAEFVGLRAERLQKFGIVIEQDISADFTVSFPKGKLTQVVDNIFRNSEFWLRHYSATNPKAPLVIGVKVDSPKLILWDSGPGVKRSIEDTIFDIFVTDKPKGEGNGLGLFIVSQLLEQEGCSIRLAPTRNAAGRHYQFSIDFSGAVSA